MSVTLEIGGRRVRLALKRSGMVNEETPDGRGLPHEFGAILARNPETGAYVGVAVGPVHKYGCPATKLGKKFGPCRCGARAMFEALVEEAGEPLVLPGYETADAIWGRTPKRGGER